jgi:hypothetical protein
MKSQTFTGRTKSQAEAKFEQWRKANPCVLEKSYHITKEGAPAGKNAPLSDMTVDRVTITVQYETSN